VLRIHDILVWIRIRGSMSLANVSGSFKIKSKKESQNSRNQGFSYYFCMIIEGSGSGAASIPLTNGSGSGRPKNMWIRWIRIRIRIRIRNTAFKQNFHLVTQYHPSLPAVLFFRLVGVPFLLNPPPPAGDRTLSQMDWNSSTASLLLHSSSLIYRLEKWKLM
jgi:hypothetical protein